MTEDGDLRSIELLDALASGLAHELGNIIVAMTTNADTLVHCLPPDSTEAAIARDVLRSAERASELVRDLLAYVGRLQLDMQPVMVADIVADTTARCEIGARVPAILGDVAQLRRAIANLVANAADAIADRAGEIAVRARCGPVDRARLVVDHLPARCGEVVHVEVEDDGIGIAPEALRRIFDPFFTTKPAHRGLGLAAVLGIVRAHAGGIAVESTPGRGTRIALAFPPHAAVDAASEHVDKGVVLVIDDEPLVRNGLRRVLRLDGYATIMAADGTEGLAAIDSHPELRAVILDITMPGMSGLEVLEQIRARRPELPVLLSSAVTEVPAGTADGFLAKPYRPEALFAALAAAIANRR